MEVASLDIKKILPEKVSKKEGNKGSMMIRKIFNSPIFSTFVTLCRTILILSDPEELEGKTFLKVRVYERVLLSELS